MIKAIETAGPKVAPRKRVGDISNSIKKNFEKHDQKLQTAFSLLEQARLYGDIRIGAESQRKLRKIAEFNLRDLIQIQQAAHEEPKLNVSRELVAKLSYLIKFAQILADRIDALHDVKTVSPSQTLGEIDVDVDFNLEGSAWDPDPVD